MLTISEAVRKRPGMYFGSPEQAGNVVVFELFANSIDQCLAGKASHINIQVADIQETDKQLTRTRISISDNGEGMPFDKPLPKNLSAKGFHNLVEYYMTQHIDQPTADGHAPHVHVSPLSMGGLGLCVLNAGCSKMSVSSVKMDKDNNYKKWQQSFVKGRVVSPAQVTRTTETQTSTHIALILDSEIFPSPCIDFSALRKEIFEISHLFPSIKTVTLNDEVIAPKQGLLDLAVLYGYADSQQRFFYHETVNDVEIQVACIASNYEPCDSLDKITFYSWVNGRRSNDGGTHVQGLLNALQIVSFIPNTAMISVLFHSPKYARPTRSKLATKWVTEVVETAVTKALKDWLHI